MDRTILVASHSNLDLVSTLKSSEYALMLKTSGKETLSYLQQNTPVLIVLDADLPDISGIDICFRLKSVSRLKQVPVLMLVDEKDSYRMTTEAQIARADQVLTLPTSKGDLKEIVMGLLPILQV